METSTIAWIALVRDLMFVSKINVGARQTGVAVRFVRQPEGLAQEQGERLLADLSIAGALEAALAWKQRTGGKVVAFVSHTAADLIAQARQGGIDQVLSNGALAGQINAILTSAR